MQTLVCLGHLDAGLVPGTEICLSRFSGNSLWCNTGKGIPGSRIGQEKLSSGTVTIMALANLTESSGAKMAFHNCLQ